MANLDTIFLTGDLNLSTGEHLLNIDGRTVGSEIALYKLVGPVQGNPTSGLDVIATTTETVSNDVDLDLHWKIGAGNLEARIGIGSRYEINGISYNFTSWCGATATTFVNGLQVFDVAGTNANSIGANNQKIALPRSIDSLAVHIEYVTTNTGPTTFDSEIDVSIDGVMMISDLLIGTFEWRVDPAETSDFDFTTAFLAALPQIY